MKIWVEPTEMKIPEDVYASIGGHPLVTQTLYRRGFRDVTTARAFLDPACYSPLPPSDLPGVELAVERLIQAVDRGETILVWGDFDVDGQTATTLLVSALRRVNGQVKYYIPIRQDESHGIHLGSLKRLLEESVPPIRILLTCDTGISAHQEIEFACAHGVDVLVTDHHELPDSLPPAQAIINPKLLPEGHPLRTLPGVGVAYKLVEGLFTQLGITEEIEADLDLVALGIVADLAEQIGETRYLLQRGLGMLRQPKRLGLQVMMELAEIDPAWLTEEHIAYILAPRLNSLGRLGDANQAVELLTTQDGFQARLLAMQLEGYNAQRQMVTHQVYQAALAQIEQDPSLLDAPVLLLSHPAWPASVIGVVASRLVERFHKPVVLISTPAGELGRASARSVEGVDITAALAANRNLLVTFGGHTMAAGFAIQTENIPELQKALARTLQQMIIPREETLAIDGYVPLSELSLDLVEDLERLAPFGPGNPPLVLATRNLRLLDYVSVGRNQEHLLLSVEDEQGVTQRVIWWQAGDVLRENTLPQAQFDLAFTVRSSTYRGQRGVQVEWIDHRPCEGAEIEIAKPSVQVVDFRQESDAVSLLKRLVVKEELLVWAEGEAMDELAQIRLERGRICHRFGLSKAKNLGIWTIPPGRAELRSGLETIAPQRVYLFGVDPGLDTMESFLKRLAGLVKHALNNKHGQVSLHQLAAEMAHREATVHKGIEWLIARGFVRFLYKEGDVMTLGLGEQEPAPHLEQITAQLKGMLDETAAYRAFFSRAEAEAVLG